VADFGVSREEVRRSRRARDTARAALAAANARRRTDRGPQAERFHSDAQSDLDSAHAQVATAIEDFARFTDPREHIGQLDDDSPFVLFPVRLETRFSTERQIGGRGNRLLVRIYPDDCSIDTFEELLSGSELSNVKRYWQNLWRAGGVEDDERAAWRDLVSAHGSGRSGYLIQTYRPVNLAQRPTKADPSDVILVIATEASLGSIEAAAVGQYWSAVWVVGDDAAGMLAARAALDAAVGVARAQELVDGYPPVNMADRPEPPATRPEVAVSAAFLVLPPDPVTKQAAWSQAPQVKHFPERFVVIGYSVGHQPVQAIGGLVRLPVYVGPDPGADPVADPTSAIHPDGADLFIPDELKWLVDFDGAVAAGMAVSIPLTDEQARTGFDRLLVLGIQLATTAEDGSGLLAEQLRHHQIGRSGLSLVPQGTPTHNTAGAPTGYTKVDDADQSFDDRSRLPLFTPTAQAAQKRDGQWVAEALGVDQATLTDVHGSDGTDQMLGRAMQRALWPATLGYWMDAMMAPVFDDDTVEDVRWFFTRYVRGAGAVPALRMGGQPYGILPTTAFSRIRWLGGATDDARVNRRPSTDSAVEERHVAFLARLHGPLTRVGSDWRALSESVAHVGLAADAHQTLLDIVGLNPSSVEFHARIAESYDELVAIQNLWDGGEDFLRALIALGLEADAATMLTELGYAGSDQPDLFQHLFFTDASPVGTVIDDQPLSEVKRIRAYTDDGRDYITWLADAAQISLDAVVAEHGFTGGKTPRAVLYLYLRHALMLGFFNAGYRLHTSHRLLGPAARLAAKLEPTFVHVADAAPASESKFAMLYKVEPNITASPTLLVAEYIAMNLRKLPTTADLAEQIDALTTLAAGSTAQLERAFAEHIDVCSYRYDAWLLGLVGYQLDLMRSRRTRDGAPAGGSYLGAYAWLENLRPSVTPLPPAPVPDGLQAVYGSTPTIRSDPRNGGYIHAPSLTHARSAAVLRSGYLANATPQNPQTMSVNLSSDRVRLALATLEGIRNGQSLGALLGYRFERGLHDGHGLAEVDKFIYPMRKAFPLAADALSSTATGPDVPIEAIEARNVLDGRKLVDHVRSTGKPTYPFGLTTLPAATGDESDAITAQANMLLDIYDAIADLALAEGVHQAVQGNFSRIGATLDAYSSGHFPPEPEVVQTPASGIGLTHRVGLHLRPGLAAAVNATPAARAEPAVDEWLGAMLPPLSTIGATVAWTDPVTDVAHTLPVTLGDLGVHPIDLLDLVLPDDIAAMTQLDDRILGHALATASPRPDAVLRIEYLKPPPGGLSIFGVSALVLQLKTLVGRARPLRATDVLLHNDARPSQDATVAVDRARIAGPKATLDTLRADLTALLAALTPLAADPVAQRGTILGTVDTHLDAAVALLDRAARFRLPASGWGFALAWRHNAFIALLGDVAGIVDRWNARLADVDARLAAYDALPASTPDDIRFGALRVAQDLVTTVVGPLPPTPAQLRAEVDSARAAFVTRRDQFVALRTLSTTAYSTALAALTALLPVTDVDPAGYSADPLSDRAVVFIRDLTGALSHLLDEIDNRRAATQAHLDQHDAAATAAAKVAALQAAAKALLGRDFRIVPEFTLAPAHAEQWATAIAASTSGELLSYLVNTAGVEEPVDEWMYGVARVRPMVNAWEAMTGLVEALVGVQAAPALLPMQLPYQPGAPWVAMRLEPGYVLDSDRLCYTAHYSTPFDKNAPQCGLLLDEWTEVIPAADRTTGITFHFNRGDNEPPQAILVVTPAGSSGRWQWDDLVGALNETLDLAKLRAVEPSQLGNTPYAVFVPATIMAAHTYNISIGTNLAIANNLSAYLPEAP
jgi:hypothetical protein